VEPTSGSNITFPVIYHDSPIDHGSSGGMLLNSDLELCGVIFAVAYEKESGDFVSGLSIPIEKVKEFLVTYSLLPDVD
jgi:S1-C subfamily serine protease